MPAVVITRNQYRIDQAALLQECGVLITYLDEVSAVAEFCDSLGARVVQLHGDIAAAELRRLRALDPALTIIKSLVVGLHPLPVLERMVRELAPHDALRT